ncbi:MAG: hypothetical protein LBF59_04040 [Prevotellaceae bacterium]|nr:hypothetical protein [Prevotellaceae bacterium]
MKITVFQTCTIIGIEFWHSGTQGMYSYSDCCLELSEGCLELPEGCLELPEDCIKTPNGTVKKIYIYYMISLNINLLNYFNYGIIAYTKIG